MTATVALTGRRGRAIATLAARVPPTVRVLTFGCLLTVAGAAMLAITPSPVTVPDRTWSLPFFALVIAFGVAEATALHVEVRKESHSLSLSSIPLMIGVLYTSPALLGLAYLVGSIPALLWIRKSSPIKAAWNACLFFCESALVALIVRSLLGDALPASAIEWLIPLGAVLAAELMSLLAVPLVIMAVDAKFRPNLFATVGRSQIVAALAGTFTVTAVSAAVWDPSMVFFAIVPIIGIGAVLKASGSVSQRYQDLQQLHTFTRTLTNERGPRTLDAGLARLVEIMRVRTAGLVVISPDDGEESTIRALMDDTLKDLRPEPIAGLLRGLLEDGGVVQLALDDHRPDVRTVLRHLAANRLLAVKVLGEVDREGVLFVTDRLGMRSEFTIDEVRLFGSLADTLSSRLSNDHLVERLEVQAQHDALTGLPNRLNFEIALTSCLSTKDRQGVVLMIDLDRFKEINDSLGHETGDRLLIEVGRRLRKATRSSDMVARFGGDEFAMLLTGRSSDVAGDLARRVSDLHRVLTAKVELDGLTFEIGASIGVSQWPEQGADSASLLHRADTAMYEAKRNQLGVVWYTPALDSDAPRRLDLYLSARAALEEGELYIHLQPKVSTGDGRITGAEALVRWTHPVHGPISPTEFVPLISQAGLIGKLTRFVIERAAETSVTLRDAGIEIPIAVNLTPRDLLDPSLPDDMAQILADVGVEPGALEVEITEDAMVVDFDTSIMVLSRIRALGVSVAIDDFGTGYSSLQHLHRLPVDHLKIDRSFVSRLAEDDSADAIVRASISLADDLGLRTVAEGIEDVRSFKFVADLGCDEVQGFLVSRPLPAMEFMRWVHEWDSGSLRAQLCSASVPTATRRLVGERPGGGTIERQLGCVGSTPAGR